MANDGHEVSARREPVRDFFQQSRLFSNGKMDDGVERNDGIKLIVFKIHLRHVRTQETRRGHELPGAHDLSFRNINPSDFVVLSQVSGNRNSTTTTEVKNPGSRGKMSFEF